MTDKFMEMVEHMDQPKTLDPTLAGTIVSTYLMLTFKRHNSVPFLILGVFMLLFPIESWSIRLLLCGMVALQIYNIWYVTAKFRKYPRFVMLAKVLGGLS